MKAKGNIIRVHVGTSLLFVSDLVGMGASLVVSSEICKLVCNRLAKAEDIICALGNFRAAIFETLPHAIRTATGGEGIEDSLMLKKLGAGGRHTSSSLIRDGDGDRLRVPLLVAEAVGFAFGVFVRMLKILDKAGLAPKKLEVVAVSVGLAVLLCFAGCVHPIVLLLIAWSGWRAALLRFVTSVEVTAVDAILEELGMVHDRFHRSIRGI